MPAFVALLLQGFVIVITSVIGQWLFGLGVGVVAYTGIGALLESVRAGVQSNAASVPASAMSVLHLVGIDTALNIVLSACAGKFAMKAAGSATLKQFAVVR
jgi:hypothetical protein